MSIEYYNNNSTSFYSSTATIDMSAIYDRFLPWIPPAGKILDAGCGSGRDSKAFIEKGYHVTPIDGSVNMAALASANLKMHVLPLKFKYMSLKFKAMSFKFKATSLNLHLCRLNFQKTTFSKLVPLEILNFFNEKQLDFSK